MFVEAFVLPVLPDAAPGFISSFLGVVNPASPVVVDTGLIAPVYTAVGIFYMLGGLLFGIASIRAGVLPRLPAIVLAVAAVLTPLAVLLPHEIQRFAAVPVGLALAWLGYTLWSIQSNAAPSELPVGVAHASAE